MGVSGPRAGLDFAELRHVALESPAVLSRTVLVTCPSRQRLGAALGRYLEASYVGLGWTQTSK